MMNCVQIVWKWLKSRSALSVAAPVRHNISVLRRTDKWRGEEEGRTFVYRIQFDYAKSNFREEEDLTRASPWIRFVTQLTYTRRFALQTLRTGVKSSQCYPSIWVQLIKNQYVE